MDETTFPNAKPHNALLIAYKAFADLAAKSSLLVITIVAARRLTPASFGVFALGSTLGWIVAVVSDCGIQLHLARAVARDPAGAARLLRGWVRVRAWTAAGAVAIVAMGLAVGMHAASATPIAILVAVYACAGLIELLHYFYRGLSRSDVESSITVGQRGATLVCGLIALAWKPDVTLLASAMLIPAVVTLAISLRIALGFAGLKPSAMSDSVARDAVVAQGPSVAQGFSPAFTRPVTWHLFRRDVWPIGAGIVLSALYFRIDVFLVQWWAGTAAVAQYNAVFRLVEALRLFPAAAIAVILPTLVRADDLRPLARLTIPLLVFAIAAVSVLWTAAGWLIPFLYGAPYAPAVPAFRVLLLCFPLLSLNFALTHQLVAWDGQRTYAGLCALALGTNVALNARLIPLWSIDGAAWATLGTEMVITAGCGIALWHARGPVKLARLVTEP